MRSGLIVKKKPNLLIADDYLLKAILAYDTGVGYASPQDGVAVDNQAFDPAEVPLLDAVMAVQKQYLKDTVYFHFGKAPESQWDSDDQQPFNLIVEGTGDDTVAKVCAMLEGEFNEYESTDHTAEFNLMDELLRDEIRTIYDAAGKDLVKFNTMLATPIVKDKLGALLSPRGNILIIPALGDATMFYTNNLQREFTGFSATKHLDYIEPVIEPEKKEPEQPVVPITAPAPARPLTSAERKARKEALAAAENTPITPVVQPTAPAEQAKPDVEVPAPQPEGLPTHLHGAKVAIKNNVPWILLPTPKPQENKHKAARNFWHNHAAILPPKDTSILEGFPAAALRATSPIAIFLNKSDKHSAFRDAMSKAQESKTKTAAAAVDNKPIKPDVGLLQQLTAEGKEQALKAIRKHDAFSTADQVKAAALPYDKFSVQAAIPLYKLLTLSVAGLWDITEDRKNALNLLNEFRMELIKAAPALLAEPPKKQEETPTVTTNRPLTSAERKQAKLAKTG